MSANDGESLLHLTGGPAFPKIIVSINDLIMEDIEIKVLAIPETIVKTRYSVACDKCCMWVQYCVMSIQSAITMPRAATTL